MQQKRLITTPFENSSGIALKGKAVRLVKQSEFVVLDTSVGGDAPKDVIKMYHYNGIMRKGSLRTWPTYIAKIGHKWYPNESITEHLITRIGQVLGLRMAHSELVSIEGTVRYCSQHFHKRDQMLNHGAEIMSAFMGEQDEKWIDDLDKQKEIKAFITVDDVFMALESRFPKVHPTLKHDLVTMLLFDALTGNNDRHYYNWGVITHVGGRHPAYFSPIYDTARALWWNTNDEFILSLQADMGLRRRRIQRYINKSVPKISVPNNEQCNHFELVEYLGATGALDGSHKAKWLDAGNINRILSIIGPEFGTLMTKERIDLIRETLSERYRLLETIIKKYP